MHLLGLGSSQLTDHLVNEINQGPCYVKSFVVMQLLTIFHPFLFCRCFRITKLGIISIFFQKSLSKIQKIKPVCSSPRALLLSVCRAVARWGLGGLQPPQYLADQLTLFRPGGTHYPRPVLLAPPEFQTLRRPCFSNQVCIGIYLTFIHKNSTQYTYTYK